MRHTIAAVVLLPRLAILAILTILVLLPPAHAAPTVVTGTIIGPSGAYPSCRLTITPGFPFTTSASVFVAQAATTVSVSSVDGSFSASLQPNVGSTPTNSYYIVRYSCTNEEYLWRVPDSVTPINYSLVQTSSVPRPPALIAASQIAPGGASDGQFLRWNSAAGYWGPATTTPSAGMADPMTTRGDLIYRGSGGTTRLPLGTSGQCITTNGTDASWGSCGLTDPLTTRGDLIIRGPSSTTRLALGSNGYCLTSNGTDAVWATCPGGLTDPMTTRGDIIYRGASGPDRRAIGSLGQCLMSNGTDPTWGACPSGFVNPLTTRGDLIYYGAAGTSRLPLGTNGYCLKSNGTDAEWGVCTTYSDPMTTLGDILYRGPSSTTRLAGNTATTRKFLRQSGTGVVSAAPVWDTITSADLPFPGTGSRGGVESKTCSGSDKLSAIGTDGVPVCAAVSTTAPYTVEITAQTSVSISAATHLQGATAVGFCFDDATPRQVVGCTYTRASNGDFVFTFSPAFTGLLQVGGAGGGGGGGGDGLGTAVAADIVALFSTCTGTKYLGADGACHDDATGGTYVAGPSGAIVINTVPNPDTVDVDTAVVPLLAQANVWTGLQDFTTAANVLIKEGTPATAATACTKGTILYDASFIYVCIATDTYKKVAIATW